MASQLPPKRDASTPRIAAPIVRGRGRPPIYNGPTLPVSFRVPEQWRTEGSKKAKGRVNLTKLFAIHYKDFLSQPIEDTLKFMEDWEFLNGPIVEDNP